MVISSEAGTVDTTDNTTATTMNLPAIGPSVSSSTFTSASPSSRLTVAVRVRPLNDAERQNRRQHVECVYPLNASRVLLVDPEKFEANVLRQNRQFERQFVFDAAFGPTSTHGEVHQQLTSPLIDFVVSGYNATVFAYGPTGSGKTYTMVGTPQSPGLMTLLTRTLYERIRGDEFVVYISFLEIYNEIIRDLLSPTGSVLDLLEDEKGNIQVPGLSRVRAPNTHKIMQILQEGNQRRTQEPTAANRSSSRSHALLQVTLHKNDAQHGKLFLIDLAGSERASQTQNRGQRLKEGAAINRSLLALGNVINALSSGGKVRYVNYRDSKLTRLLKDSLGGTSMTCMIAHVTPSSANYDETYNTLVYANRAKNITNRLARTAALQQPQPRLRHAAAPPRRRPSSAEQLYHSAMQTIRQRMAEARGAADRDDPDHSTSTSQMTTASTVSETAETTTTHPHHHRSITTTMTTTTAAASASSTTISDGGRRSSRETPAALTTTAVSGGGTNARFHFNGGGSAASDLRKFTTLFNALKEQFLAGCERQQRFRERLLKANYEAYDANLNRISKAAILTAWERHSEEDETKYSHIIERIRHDSAEHEKRYAQLQDIREKIERAQRRGGETLQALEKRMRALARGNAQQTEFVDLLVRMAVRDAESMAATSDSVLQALRLRRQENSLLKIEKYEQIADKLICCDNLPEEDRDALQAEYKVVRNQLNYHLIPLKQLEALDVVSWNSQYLRSALRQYARGKKPNTLMLILGGGSDGESCGKRFSIAPKCEKPVDDIHGRLPEITGGVDCGKRGRRKTDASSGGESENGSRRSSSTENENTALSSPTVKGPTSSTPNQFIMDQQSSAEHLESEPPSSMLSPTDKMNRTVVLNAQGKRLPVI